ncbi:MAG: serine O-acetyltransferase [Pseudomonadota bacterium]
MFKRLREDIDTIMARDPAARSRITVFFTCPGLHAVMFYRLSHRLWNWRMRGLGLWLSYISRMFTNIEIHPAAKIGRRFFIDHGTGVVVGETTEIGEDVTLYQGVTLGGTSSEAGKRHPTLLDGVIVGAGAKILGPHVIGKNARVGSNAVVLKNVPEAVTVVGVPARPAGMPKAANPEFLAYGTPTDDLPDPVARAVHGLNEELATLRQRIVQLEDELAHHREHAPDASVDCRASDAPSREGRC